MRSTLRRLSATTFVLLVSAAFSAGPSSAQEGEEVDIFRDLGTSSVVEEGAGQRLGEGTIAGRVFDGQTGAAIGNVSVILTHPAQPGVEPKVESS